MTELAQGTSKGEPGAPSRVRLAPPSLDAPAKAPGVFNVLKTSLGRFRLVALAEGLSYVLLVCVAMPVRALLEVPQGVSIMGRIHGALVIVFLLALIDVSLKQRWSLAKASLGFVASLIPFGAFIFDARVKHEVPAEHEPS